MENSGFDRILIQGDQVSLHNARGKPIPLSRTGGRQPRGACACEAIGRHRMPASRRVPRVRVFAAAGCRREVRQLGWSAYALTYDGSEDSLRRSTKNTSRLAPRKRDASMTRSFPARPLVVALAAFASSLRLLPSVSGLMRRHRSLRAHPGSPPSIHLSVSITQG